MDKEYSKFYEYWMIVSWTLDWTFCQHIEAGCTFHNDAIDALLQETVLIHLVWTWLNYVVLEQKIFWILTSLYYLKVVEQTKLLWKQLAQIGKWLKFVLNDTRPFDWI